MATGSLSLQPFNASIAAAFRCCHRASVPLDRSGDGAASVPPSKFDATPANRDVDATTTAVMIPLASDLHI
jgi:hypothetical protein